MAGKNRLARTAPEGFMPLLDVSGTAAECGRLLGHQWQEPLKLAEQGRRADARPWWMARAYARIIDRYAPHLPAFCQAMAKGAGVSERGVSVDIPPEREGCTSFAVAPGGTLDGLPISGQTKDNATMRAMAFQVLRLAMTDAPPMLTVTYPGQLFGHGFVRGGCAIFRNGIWAGANAEGRLAYSAWGLLSLHCPTAGEAVELAKKYGVREAAHCTIADEKGGIAGLEMTAAGVAVLKPNRGLYVHANCVLGGARHVKREAQNANCTREDSLHRGERLHALLEPELGRLTAARAFAALADHDGFPMSICRHQSANSTTTAAMVAEPTRGLLHVCRGSPCQSWARTYRL